MGLRQFRTRLATITEFGGQGIHRPHEYWQETREMSCGPLARYDNQTIHWVISLPLTRCVPVG